MRVQTRKETYEDRFARKYYCNTDRFTSKMKRENRRQLRRTLKALQEQEVQEYDLVTEKQIY